MHLGISMDPEWDNNPMPGHVYPYKIKLRGLQHEWDILTEQLKKIFKENVDNFYRINCSPDEVDSHKPPAQVKMAQLLYNQKYHKMMIGIFDVETSPPELD